MKYSLRPDGQLTPELFNKEFAGNALVEDENSNKIKAFDVIESPDEIKMIFDISMGLQPAFMTFDEKIVKPVRDAFKYQKFYKCGHTYENIVEEHSGNLDYFRSIETYRSHGCVKSHIKGGLEEAVREKDKISIFFTDFLYDERGGQFQASSINNPSATISINNDLENGWGADMIAEWFKSGGKLYVFYDQFKNTSWANSDPTNYFALLFMPRGVEPNDKLKLVIANNQYFVFDPLNVYLDMGSLKNTLSKIDNTHIYFDDKRMGAMAIGAPFDKLKELEDYQLANFESHNNSNMWSDLVFTVKSENILDKVKIHSQSKILGLKPKDQSISFFQIEPNDREIFFNDGNMNEKTYSKTDLFSWRYTFNLTNMSNALNVDNQRYREAMISPVRTDGRREDFMNQALFLSISKAIDQSKQQVLNDLTDRSLFNLYTFVWVKKNN
jgi:hypothetical protein